MSVFDPAVPLLESMFGCGRDLKTYLDRHPDTDFPVYADRTIVKGLRACADDVPELGDKKAFLTVVSGWLRNNGHLDGPDKRGVQTRLADIAHANTGANEAMLLSKLVIEQRYRHHARDLGKRLEDWRTIPIGELDKVLREAWTNFIGLADVTGNTEMKEAS